MTDMVHSEDRPHQIPGLSVPAALTDEIKIELRRAALQARSSAARVHGGGGFHARRSQRLYLNFVRLSFVVMVIAPMTYATAYLWAMPAQYVTESRLSVVSQDNPMSGFLSSLVGRENSGEAYLINYLKSSNIVAALLEDDPDLISRSGVLRENAVVAALTEKDTSLERQLELWTNHVIVDRQSFTSTIELSVATLTANSSLELHEKILSLAEQHVNFVSERQRATQVSEAAKALKEAQIALRNAISQLHEVRQKYNMIDPELEATQRVSLIYQLEQQQADRLQRVEVLQRRNMEDPQIRQLESQIEALEIQKEALRQSIAGSVTMSGATVAEAEAEISLSEADVRIARDELAQRMFQLSEARQNASRQSVFLQRSVSPVLPQSPHKAPKLLYGIMVLTATIALWLVAAGLGALIRDHAR